MFEIWYLTAGGDHFARHWSGGRGSLSAAERVWLVWPIGSVIRSHSDTTRSTKVRPADAVRWSREEEETWPWPQQRRADNLTQAL